MPVVAPSLALTKTHAGTFTVGQPGTFTLNVSNRHGPDGRPGGRHRHLAQRLDLRVGERDGVELFGIVAAARIVLLSAALAAGAAAPPIALVVNVANAAAPSATNTATATNGASSNAPTASDTVAVSGTAQFTAVSKLVNGLHAALASTGDIVGYQIAFTNNGATAATNVVVTDTFPAGTLPSAASVKLNGSSAGFTATLIGQTLAVTIPLVAAGATATVTVNATITAGASGNGLVNTAQVTAGNAPPQTTGPATVLVGTSNVVYDGSQINAQGQPAFTIPNASVALVNPSTREPESLPTPGTNVNPANANPFATTEDGQFSFALGGRHSADPARRARSN